MARHLSTAPGRQLAVPCLGWPPAAQPSLPPHPPHFCSTPPQSHFVVEIRTIVMFCCLIPQRWAVEHCCSNSVQHDCGIRWSTPASPCRFFLLGLQVRVVAWQCSVLGVGQVVWTNCWAQQASDVLVLGEWRAAVGHLHQPDLCSSLMSQRLGAHVEPGQWWASGYPWSSWDTVSCSISGALLVEGCYIQC